MATASDLQDNNEEQQQTSKAGRPRSEQSRKKILDATRRLLTHTSMSDLSIEAIAKKAKVGKTTIYRWWPNKATVAMEAFIEQPGLQHVTPTTRSTIDALRHLIESMIRQLRGQNGRIIAGIIAESQSNDEVLDLLYEAFLKERVETLFTRIEEGKKNGELRDDLDAEIAVDMIMGPLFLRVLSGEDAIDDHFAENYPEQVLLALKA